MKRLSVPLLIWLFISADAFTQSAVQKDKADRAKAAMVARNFDEAATLYTELVRELPSVAGLKMNLGMAYYSGGKLNEAVKYLTLAVQGDPTMTQAWLLLASVQLEAGRPQEAIKAAQRYLKEKPGDPNALRILGDAFLRSEQYEKSVGAFGQLAERTRESPRAWYGLGKSYEGLAGQAFAKLEKAAPESGYWFALIADSRMTLKQYASAFYFFRKALEKQPDLRGIHVAIARIYRQTEHPDWAEKEEKKELELGEPACDKEPLVCDFLAGRLRDVLQKTSKLASAEGYYWQTQTCNLLALAAFSRLEELPPSLEAHELRAEIHREQRRHFESVKEWQKALELSPNDPRLKRELAYSLYLKRDYDAAQPIIDELLKADSSSGDLNYLAGDILLYQQKVEQALPFLEKAVKYSPDIMGAQSALGRAYMDLEEPAKAIAHLKAALPSDEDGSLHFQLSRAYQRTGQAQLAKETLAQYQEITKLKQSEDKKLLEEVKITPP